MFQFFKVAVVLIIYINGNAGNLFCCENLVLFSFIFKMIMLKGNIKPRQVKVVF